MDINFKLSRTFSTLLMIFISAGCNEHDRTAKESADHRDTKRIQSIDSGGEKNAANDQPKHGRIGSADGSQLDLTDDAIETRLSSAEFVRSPANYQEASRLLVALAKHDPERAMSLIPAMPSGLQILFIQDSGSAYLAGVGEQKLIEWLKPSVDQARGVAVGLAIDVLAKVAAKDPEEALRILAKNTSKSSAMLIANTMLGIAGADPDHAMELVKKHLRDDQMGAAVAGIVERLSLTSPDKAIDIVKANLTGPEAERSYARVLGRAVEGNPALVGGLLEGIPAQSMLGVLSAPGMVEKLLTLDSAKATAALGSVAFTGNSMSLYTRVAVGLAEQDSGKAIEFVRALPQGQASSQLVGSVFEVLAKSDYQKAMDAMKDLDPAGQQTALRAVARTVAGEDFEKAIGLANQAPLDQQQNVYREVARTSAYQSPNNAVRILEDPDLSQRIGSDFRAEMLNTTVQTWAKQDFPAVQQWVEKLPATDAAKGYQGLMTAWMKTDPVAASGWLSNQPVGPAREAGARVIIDQIKDTDPDMAEQWRKTLPPEGGKP